MTDQDKKAAEENPGRDGLANAYADGMLRDILDNQLESNPVLDWLRSKVGPSEEQSGALIPITPHIAARIMPSIPPGSNPFSIDQYNMGTRIAANVYIMHKTHESDKADYLIVVNTDTGERVRLLLS